MPERGMRHRRIARIVHASPGRLRLRIRGMPAEDLQSMRARIADIAGVRAARADPMTGSILVHGEDLDMDALATIGREFGLALAGNEEIRSLIEHLGQGFTTVDDRLRRLSGGHLDLASLAALALLGGAAVQLLRGRFAASGVTMLWYAASTAMAVRSAGRTRLS